MGEKPNKTVPPGWNDPPPISPALVGPKPGAKLTKRVAYPLSGITNKPSEPLSSIPLAKPPETTLPPLLPGSVNLTEQNQPPTTPLSSRKPDPASTYGIIIDLKELVKIIEDLIEAQGKEKISELNHRLGVLKENWSSLDANTKQYTYEAFKNLTDGNVIAAKQYHEKLVLECGVNVVHWIVMLKILIGNMSVES